MKNLMIFQGKPVRKCQMSNVKCQIVTRGKSKVHKIKLIPNSYTLVPNLGFTLIELIITLGIISILTGVILAEYSRFSQRQVLIAAGQNMRNILSDAQNRALSSEIDCSIDICNCTPSNFSSFSGWYVDFSSQTIYGECAGKTFSAKPFGLPVDIAITPHITPPVKILFRSSPLGGSVISPNQNITLCLSQANLSNIYYAVHVNQAGVISTDNGLAASCP